MVVAAAVANLRVLSLANACTDGHRRPKIERCASDRGDLTGRDERRVHRRHRVGVDGELVGENVTASVAGKVPVRVLREIDRRRLVTRRPIVDDQTIVVRQRVSDAGAKRSGIALLHVRAGVIENDAHPAHIPERFGVPDDFVETSDATVQTIRPVVHGEPIGRPIEGESAAGNPIAVATDDRAEVRGIAKVAAQTVVPEHDIVELTRAVRRLQRGDDAAVVRQPDFDTVGVRQRKQIDGPSVRRLAEWRASDAAPHRRCAPRCCGDRHAADLTE